MARMGVVIVIGAIIISMGVALYTFTQYQPNFIETTAGETVIVGPVEYQITFEGTHNGDKDTKPEHTFVKIRINAKNISDEDTRITGGQFFFIDTKGQKHQPIYGEFSEEDLLDDILEPNKPVTWTTQFDVPFDENEQYNIAIRPTKQHESMDTAIICITNC